MTHTEQADRGQVSVSAAEVYDTFFVPALFAQWVEVVLTAGDVQLGNSVLDVGCGTGVLARAARARVGESGTVAGLEPNAGMLALAERADPRVDWRTGVAEGLPFSDSYFDRTVSQFAAMFFSDAKASLGEIRRVTKPGGRIALAVWDRLENNVGYSRLTTLIAELFGPDAADALRSPFQLGDPDLLTDLAAEAVTGATITAHRGVARFDSLPAWLHTEIRGWTLADKVDDDDFARLLDAASHELSDLVHEDGVSFEVSALVLSGSPSA